MALTWFWSVRSSLADYYCQRWRAPLRAAICPPGKSYLRLCGMGTLKWVAIRNELFRRWRMEFSSAVLSPSYESLPIAGCKLLTINEFHLPLLSQLHSAFDPNRSSLDFSARVDYFHRSYFKDRFALMEYLQHKLLPICDGRCRSFSLDVDLLYASLIAYELIAKSDMGRVEISKFVRLQRLSTSLPIKFQ